MYVVITHIGSVRFGGRRMPEWREKNQYKQNLNPSTEYSDRSKEATSSAASVLALPLSSLSIGNHTVPRQDSNTPLTTILCAHASIHMLRY